MDGERGKVVSKSFREWTQFGIVLFATAWGVYTFVYKETILPSRRPATLTVSTNLEELGRAENKVLIRLRVHAVNRTDRKVYVPALWYTVCGLKLAEQPGDQSEYRSQVEFAPEAEIQARFSSITAADVVAVGSILGRITSYYEPTDETTNEVLFEVPVEKYDALQARAQFFLTRDTDGLAISGWRVGERGELEPKLLLSGRPYEPEYNAQHYAWAIGMGAGFNWSSSTLALWPKRSSAPETDSTAEPRLTSRP